MARARERSSSAPLLWRMRHSIGRAWFFVALAMGALGIFVVAYAIATGEMSMLGIGLTLAVGSALLAVGLRRKK